MLVQVLSSFFSSCKTAEKAYSISILAKMLTLLE